MSINWYTNKGNTAYPHMGNYSAIKKEWRIDICYNTDEPQKYYSKWNKPITRDHVFYYSIYMKYINKSGVVENNLIIA